VYLTEQPDPAAAPPETGIASCDRANCATNNTLTKREVFFNKFISLDINLIIHSSKNKFKLICVKYR
jgi:hypothetical protein